MEKKKRNICNGKGNVFPGGRGGGVPRGPVTSAVQGPVWWYPSPVTGPAGRGGGTSARKGVPLLRQDRDSPPRTGERVFATQWAVRLLWSRSGTVLFCSNLLVF